MASHCGNIPNSLNILPAFELKYKNSKFFYDILQVPTRSPPHLEFLEGGVRTMGGGDDTKILSSIIMIVKYTFLCVDRYNGKILNDD